MGRNLMLILFLVEQKIIQQLNGKESINDNNTSTKIINIY